MSGCVAEIKAEDIKGLFGWLRRCWTSCGIMHTVTYLTLTFLLSSVCPVHFSSRDSSHRLCLVLRFSINSIKFA